MTDVILQAGHVDRKTGSTGTTGEQAFNLAVCRLAAAEIVRRGKTAKVILADAARTAYKGSYFVAVHADGSTTKTAKGSSVGYRDPRGKTLATAIKAHYKARAGKAAPPYPITFRADNYTTALRLYYGTGYALSQNALCRAVIVEGGFLTNATERAWLNSAAGRKALAYAIADSIVPARAPAPAPAPKPPSRGSVSLSRVRTAFAARQDDVSNDTEQVQRALNARYPKLPKLRVDGIVDDKTRARYKYHQTVLYGAGPDADGDPGKASLENLGFRVTR